MNNKPLEMYPLFSVPFFRIDYDDAENFQKTASDIIYQLEKTDSIDLSNCYTANSYTSFYSNAQILELNEFSGLKNFVISSIEQINNSVGFETEFSLFNSWANINRKYSYHESHTHLPHLWSGVYYVKADDGDATISFSNKNIIDIGWPYSVKKTNNYDCVTNQITCQVSTGMMIVFPSYLPHKVDQHMNDSDRISIAFNISVPQ